MSTETNDTFFRVCFRVLDALNEAMNDKWNVQKLKEERNMMRNLDFEMSKAKVTKETSVKCNIEWFTILDLKIKLIEAKCIDIDNLLTIQHDYSLKYSEFEKNDIQTVIVSWWFYKDIETLQKKKLNELLKISANKFYIQHLLQVQQQYLAINPFKNFSSIQYFLQITSWFARVRSYCWRNGLVIRLNVMNALQMEQFDHATSFKLTDEGEMMTKFFFPAIKTTGPYQSSNGCQIAWYYDIQSDCKDYKILQVKFTVKRLYNVIVNILQQTENFIKFPIPAKTLLKKVPFQAKTKNQQDKMALDIEFF